MTDHPITPPPELVVQWIKEFSQPNDPRWQEYEQDIATRAAQWGADTELEACCKWLVSEGWFRYEHEAVQDLRAARRPKPPSLKEQALACCNDYIDPDGIIRRAIESLPD